jgi:hypothetical protein
MAAKIRFSNQAGKIDKEEKNNKFLLPTTVCFLLMKLLQHKSAQQVMRRMMELGSK